MLGRTLEATYAQTIRQKAHDLVDVLDATLATLDARIPFTKRLQEILNVTKARFHRESLEELKRLPNETETPAK